jgi:CO/xanthine dehydrogenase FAD-binding subunit
VRSFTYERPTTLAAAIELLAVPGADARALAGGTDLIIRLRDGTLQPSVVVDLKRVAELRPQISVRDGALVISAGSVMTDIAAHPLVRERFTSLAEAAAVIGAVQIRNRATLAGNICNASPAADTATPLLVHDARVVVAGPDGTRRIGLDDFFVRSGVTVLRPAELVTALELPITDRRVGSVHLRRTRRRGHDLASVTLSCAVDEAGVTRLAYGSVGPRPFLAVDASGVLADPAPTPARDALLEELLGRAAPSPRSMRSGPEYRLAMLRVMAARALATAIERVAR